MRAAWRCGIGTAVVSLIATMVLQAQAPAPPAGGARAGGAGAGQAAAPPLLMPHQQAPVDQAAHDAGKLVWQAQCVDCHGGSARGTETGPNIVWSETVNFDRWAQPGSVLGPYLKKGHKTMTGRAVTDPEIVQLAQFLRQRVNETLRGGGVTVRPENVITGNARAGEAFFNGAGGCTQCHNATRLSLAGIGSRITNPQTLQGRVLYPAPAIPGAAPARGGGAAAPAAAPAGNPTGPTPPSPLALKVTITPASGPAVSGTLVSQDAFFIVYGDDTGVRRTLRKTPTMKIVVTNPMQWHLDFVDRITDAQMHDLTAYLWSLK